MTKLLITAIVQTCHFCTQLLAVSEDVPSTVACHAKFGTIFISCSHLARDSNVEPWLLVHEVSVIFSPERRLVIVGNCSLSSLSLSLSLFHSLSSFLL